MTTLDTKAPLGSINWRHLLLGFDGRISRTQYWVGLVVTVLIYAASVTLTTIVNSEALTALMGPLKLGLGWPLLAVHAKRWHDQDRTGWWTGTGFIPVVGWLIVLIACGAVPGDNGSNRYGSHPFAKPGVDPTALSDSIADEGHDDPETAADSVLPLAVTRERVAERASTLMTESDRTWTEAWDEAASELGLPTKKPVPTGCLIGVWAAGLFGTFIGVVGVVAMYSGVADLGVLLLVFQLFWGLPLFITAIGMTVAALRARRRARG